MNVRVNDLLGVGLLLVGIFIFSISLRETGFLKIMGLAGSIILFIVETIYLWQYWRRK